MRPPQRQGTPPKRDALVAEGLACGYGHGFAVTDVDLRVEAGRICCLIGPNGAGKSTLLKAFAAELAPQAGTLLLQGRDVIGLSPAELARLRSTLITDRPRTELVTARDVVSLGRLPHTGALGRLTAGDRERVAWAMGVASVRDLADLEFSRLSDGQRQRVLLARAIAQEPEVLMLDEPCNYLDIRHRIELVRALSALARETGVAIVATMHDIALAARLADWLVCVRDGAIMCQGPREDVLVPAIVERLFDLAPGDFDAASGAYTFSLGGGR
jgi:iron complex transport system ATP-binding protein